MLIASYEYPGALVSYERFHDVRYHDTILSLAMLFESIFSLSGSQSGSYEHRTVFTPFPESIFSLSGSLWRHISAIIH